MRNRLFRVWVFKNILWFSIFTPIGWFSVVSSGYLARFVEKNLGTRTTNLDLVVLLLQLVVTCGIVGYLLGTIQSKVIYSSSLKVTSWTNLTLVGLVVGLPVAAIVTLPIIYVNPAVSFGLFGYLMGLSMTVAQAIDIGRQINWRLWVGLCPLGTGLGLYLGYSVVMAFGKVLVAGDFPGYITNSWQVVRWFIVGSIVGAIYSIVSGSLLFCGSRSARGGESDYSKNNMAK